jgi:hypothetical protein
MTFDELEAADFQETGLVQVQRQSLGRSSDEVTMARRLHVLSLYSSGLTREIYRYVEAQGFSRKTAENDIMWAKQEWRELNSSQDTALDIIERHQAKYYEYAHRAEAAGDLKLAKEMLQAIEKLRGFHQANVAVQVNTGFVQHNTTNTQVNYNLEALTLEELQQMQLLVAKTSLPM